ncbi:hypothetical protein M427DRAFT_64141 [Gonapodya prolifera JEL478]|uniref:WD40 repeat-like protein n=1 Tax=Gonapodya prolifera (strain JEL478) TaxID=1344416 RepID=A0A138ZYW1_GONPJ|nr:hypothetical protein M427DRAFT_64141 [Gonapodya prolifera JEL478]|eukprot:KXS09465.1 hypothetical protein M427DRAFT_64141 [Gonapodya prolifera JEL478]
MECDCGSFALRQSPSDMRLRRQSTRVSSTSGAFLCQWKKHNGPVFFNQCNKRGNLVLSGSGDKAAVVWNVAGVGQGEQHEVTGGSWRG